MTPTYQDYAASALGLMAPRVEIAAALDIAGAIQRDKQHQPGGIAQAGAEAEAKLMQWGGHDHR